MAALEILSKGFIKKYKLKQNLIRRKLDYIELSTKKNTQMHKILQFLSTPPHPLCAMVTPQEVLVKYGDKGQGSSLQKQALHTYTFRLR